MIPPVEEVNKGRYHYFDCPLTIQPPMDYRTFLHYMTRHGLEGGKSYNDTKFLKRLPKKLETSILSEGGVSELPFGWGVHIIEGPNTALISWIVFAVLLLSFVVSVVFAKSANTQEQGFGIGQWLVAVLSAALAAAYFQMAEY